MDKRREQQARTESKTRAVVRINLCLQSGDYSRALDLLKGSAAEFPNDVELSELEKLAQDGAKRSADANRLITESQELFAQQKSAQAIQSLREAYELDKNNALSRSILANALVEHAHSIVETDWWEAETLANEALALHPTHPTARTVHSRILDEKKAGSIDEWVSQTQKLQTAGNLSAALSQIAEGFAVYPREPRLLQIQDAIQRDYGTQRRQARRRDLDDLRRTATEVDAAADAVAKKAIAERIQAVTVKYSTDGEILSIANALLLRLGQGGVAQKNGTAEAESEAAPAIYQAPPPKSPESLLAASSPPLPKPIPAGRAAPGKVGKGKVSASVVPGKGPEKVPGIVAASAPKPQADAPPIAAPRAVAVAVAEPAAPATVPSRPMPARPLPAAPAARSSSTMLIVGSAAAIIVVAAISYFAGTHHASTGAKTPANLSTAAPSGSAPASAPASPVTTGPASGESSPPAGQGSSDAVAEKVTPANQPSAQPPADLQADNRGTMLVVTGQDNAKVFLNGKLQRQVTQAGQLRLPNLELKDYVVQVSKNGFQDPPQQKIRIRGGEQARLVFTLQPNPQPQPRLASLTIQGGAPGTTVLVDQALVGTVQPDGTLAISTVSPGDHTVELRKERFKARQFKKHFVAGGAISLAAADAALEAVPGELKIAYAPADAKVVIAKAGVPATMVSSGVPLNLAAGTYTLTARTADAFTRYATLEVLPGQSKTVDLSLAPNGMSKWDDPGAWKHEGDSFVHKGGDFVLYGVVPVSGTFALSAMLTKGHLLQWVVNYTDAKNYVLFQMDDNNFYRSVIHNGVKTDEIKVADKEDKKSFRTLHIRVSPTEIVHQIKHGDRWTVLDRWTQPGVNLSLGKFGFYIPGSDQVALSSFAQYADLNIR